MEIRREIGTGILGVGAEYSAELNLILTEDGYAAIEAIESHNGMNGVPEKIWNGRTRLWSCRGGKLVMADKGKIEALCEKLSPLLDRVHAGHEVEWDGSNYKGRLITEDAADASGEIDDLFRDAWECDWQRDDVEIWDADDWCGSDRAGILRDYGITADTTDEEIPEIAKAIESEARPDVILVNTEGAIRGYRDELVEEREDAA